MFFEAINNLLAIVIIKAGFHENSAKHVADSLPFLLITVVQLAVAL